MRNPSLQQGDLSSGKQPMSVELTSGTGERTFDEAAFRLNWRNKSLTLPTLQHSITGILKPVDLFLVLPESTVNKL
jgi:hypothetical protein